MREPLTGKTKRVHPYQWLWEPLEGGPTFLLRSTFGGRSVYLDGKLMLYFTAGEEPWRGAAIPVWASARNRRGADDPRRDDQPASGQPVPSSTASSHSRRNWLV